jgi:hypothetical protein
MRGSERSALLLVAAILLAPLSARADRAEAERLFAEGRKLAVAGRCEEAIEIFKKSLTEEPSVGGLLNMGDCEARLGQVVAARRSFERAEQLARRTDPERAEEAVRRQVGVEQRIASIRVRVVDASVDVLVDGMHALPGEIVALDPGEHRVSASAPRKISRTITVALREGEKERTVEIPALDNEPTLAPQPVVVVRPPVQRSAWPYVLGGIGVGALALGGVGGGVAIGARSDIDAACPDYPACPNDRLADVKEAEGRAKDWATLSTISVTAGVALVAGAVVWLLLDAKPARTKAASAL